MLFLRVFQHLLPRSQAWKVTIEKTLRKFFVGLAGPMDDAREFVDEVYEDLRPETTRELAEWEHQFNIPAEALEATRRANLDAAWKATGGQDPNYIQNVIWAAGFTTVYLHEWWKPDDTPHDPRDYTTHPRVGEFLCDAEADDDQPVCAARVLPDGSPYNQPQCSRMLLNDPGYIVNETLRFDAPPPVPDDPATWPYFLYFTAQTFGYRAVIDEERLPELKRLLLKICPTQHWIVLRVRFDEGPDEYFNFNTGGGFNVTKWFDYGD